MRHIIFQEADTYPVAVLTKTSSFNKMELQRNYVQPLVQLGLSVPDMIGFNLKYDDAGKAPVGFIKKYLTEQLLPALDGIKTQFLYVCDSAYFKVLAGVTKSEPHYGYCLPVKLKGYEHMQVVLGLNYQALIYNPDLQGKLDMSLSCLARTIQGTHTALGAGIIHSASYPESLSDIAKALESLHQYPELVCDLEAFSLRFNEAGIGSIGFAWDQHNGLAFACDYRPNGVENTEGAKNFDYGFQHLNKEVRALLLKFFETYEGTLTFHNATFDIKLLIYGLWMKHALDMEGLLTGLHRMCRSFHDTKIIAYLATNSTAGNVLGLKALAHEFAGNWAVEDIKDIRKIPLPQLLQYNLVDCLSTWYVKNKYYPIMVDDRQEELYFSLMLPSQKLITQIELTGMPMDASVIQRVKDELTKEAGKHFDIVMNHPLIAQLNLIVQTKAMNDANAKLKTKQHPLSVFNTPGTPHYKSFNPGSGKQLQVLLYDLMGLPIIDTTDKGAPATGGETLDKLINHSNDPGVKLVLGSLITFGKIQKILSAFIPAFERALAKADGMVYLHGSFNLGGTVSGRLSSSDPNMQNIPANSTYAKLIKMCFMAAMGWLFVGADFASLEDRINALLTKDPAKLKVYTDGYDGHALRAFAYFGDDMPGIVETVESINSIAEKSSPFYYLRQDSKSPTFALTYQGTYRTLMTNLGWSKEKAMKVEANYMKLYAVSMQWVKDKIAQAAKDGYAEAAFGLRIRTPLLKQTYLGMGKATPSAAEAEGRTLGNAISGQSYGLLNNRAAVAFMELVWAHEEYRYLIKPVALIHDAIYLVIKDDPAIVEWVNIHLPKEMSWQQLPEIQHDQVKLGAELDIYWPDWANPMTLPNNATQAQIIELCGKHHAKLEEKKKAA
jgi:DNA polymerase-1